MRYVFPLILLLIWPPAQGQALHVLAVQPLQLFDLPPGFDDLGTFSLSSDAQGFGGLSALLIDGQGRVLSVSDQGYGIEFLDLEIGEGAVTAPTEVQIRPLDLLSDHQPASHRRDAESLAWLDRDGDPRLYIGFERDHRLQRHLPDGTAETRLPKPIALQGTFGNTGLEAVSSLPGACLFAVTEGVRRQGVPHPGALSVKP